MPTAVPVIEVAVSLLADVPTVVLLSLTIPKPAANPPPTVSSARQSVMKFLEPFSKRKPNALFGADRVLLFRPTTSNQKTYPLID